MFDPIPVCERGRNCIQLKGTTNDDCSICLESKHGKRLKHLGCKHSFHVKCINKWLQKNEACPLCRTPARILTLQEMIDKIIAGLTFLDTNSQLLDVIDPIFDIDDLD